MRHRKKNKLKKGYNLDRRLTRQMSSSLILHEKIQTTKKRGKLIRSEVEKLITKGKIGDLNNKRILFARLEKNAARKVFEVLALKYKNRAGGFTRLLQIGSLKDGTP